MPTTTAVFKFTPGQEIEHNPELDVLIVTVPGVPLSGMPVFATNGVTATNKISDTIDLETATRTIVREWASNEIATEFVTELQTSYAETGDSINWPGQLISVQVNS